LNSALGRRFLSIVHSLASRLTLSHSSLLSFSFCMHLFRSACLQTRVNSAEYMTSSRKLGQHGAQKKDDGDDDISGNDVDDEKAAIDPWENGSPGHHTFVFSPYFVSRFSVMWTRKRAHALHYSIRGDKNIIVGCTELFRGFLSR